MKEQLLPIGTKVFDIRFGWGEIININSEPYIYKVNFKIHSTSIFYYDINGKSINFQINPTLSLTEYDLYNGGFTPLSDYNKPKVGDFGYFWDDDMESKKRLVFSVIDKIIDGCYYDSNVTNWENFSKEIPEWFKKIMNEKNSNK